MSLSGQTCNFLVPSVLAALDGWGLEQPGDEKLGRLVLIRHCETDSNALGLVQGHSDAPLSARGREQVKLVGEYTGRTFSIDRVLSSDRSRCIDTARAIDAPVSASPLLRELDFGEWEGRKWSELQAQHPATLKRMQRGEPSFAPPGGESISSLNERAERLIVEEHLIQANNTVAIVSHAGFLRSLAASILNWSAANAASRALFVGSVSTINTDAGNPRLEVLNYFEHLVPSYANNPVESDVN